MMSVHGTDFCIPEPRPFSTIWYSHKHNGSCVRYEVAVGISTGRIVWTNGLFQAGAWSDLSIACKDLFDAMDADEMFVADTGYFDNFDYAMTPTQRNR